MALGEPAVSARAEWLPGPVLAERIRDAYADAIEAEDARWVVVRPERWLEVARFLRDDAELDLSYLNAVSGVDRLTHFEIVYHFTSLAKNHMAVVKVLAQGRENPEAPSVTSVWHGAHLQEREVYDLMGVRFAGHPNLKRLLLWEGFAGHPLRKDFLTMPGGVKPGLRRFVREFPEGQEGYTHVPQD